MFPSLLVTPLAFEQVVSLTRSVDESEEFSHVVSGEMSSDVFFRIDDAGREVLFVRLSLEDCERDSFEISFGRKRGG